MRRIPRETLERIAALFASDDEFFDVVVHERKREAARGRSRAEVLDLMSEDYTYLNRPLAVRGPDVAAGPLRLNGARYDALFPPR